MAATTRIEFKGLAGAVAAAKDCARAVRGEMAGLQSDAAKLTMTVRDLRDQLQAAQADIEFEVSTLANAPASNDFQPESKEGKSDGQ